MSNQDETIKHIFSLGRLSRKYEVCKDDNCYFTLQTLFILTATYWVFMVLLGGIVIPGGLFMPSIMVRSSLQVHAGRAVLAIVPRKVPSNRVLPSHIMTVLPSSCLCGAPQCFPWCCPCFPWLSLSGAYSIITSWQPPLEDDCDGTR